MLRADHWEARFDALRPAGVLIQGWRADYRELVGLIGDQLPDAEPRLATLAGQILEYLGDVARPAADALARQLDLAPRSASHEHRDRSPWLILWPRNPPSPGPVLRALARLRDPRALPAIRWALDHDPMPPDVGHLIAAYGPDATDLVPAIRHRLRELPTVDGHDQARGGLVRALDHIGPAAVAALPELLAVNPDDHLARVLGRFGPAAAAAVPMLRGLVDGDRATQAVAAAIALWRITADPGPALAACGRHLRGDQFAVRDAADALAELGPVAARYAARMRRVAHDPNRGGFVRLAAARAVWRIAGDVEAAVPVLGSVWEEKPATRLAAARTLVELGPAAAPLLPLVREETAARRRHTASDHGWSSAQVVEDEELLALCRTLD